MNNYAIIDNKKIINVVVAESKEMAEQITGKEVIETTGAPWIDWILLNDVWTAPDLIQETTGE